MKNYLGIDWGKKRIGLAFAEDETKIVMPLKAVFGLNEVLDEIVKNEVDIIVIGMPFQLDKAEINSSIKDDFLSFVSQLEEKSGLKVEGIDERFTSKQADMMSFEKGRDGRRDINSAIVILQNYLDKIDAL